MPPHLKTARRFEERFAEDIGGRRIFLSGAGFEKADVRRSKRFTRDEAGNPVRTEALALRGEAKTTQHDSYSFKAQDWADVYRAATKAGEMPLFAIWFTRIAEGLVVMPRDFAAELVIPPAETLLQVKKSVVLRPAAHNDLRITVQQYGATRTHVLTVTPYPTFMGALHAYAHPAQVGTASR